MCPTPVTRTVAPLNTYTFLENGHFDRFRCHFANVEIEALLSSNTSACVCGGARAQPTHRSFDAHLSPRPRHGRPPCNARVIAELRTQRTTLPHFLCRPTPSPHPSATATSRSCTARSDSSARSFSSSTSRLLPQQLPQATELSIPAERLGGGLKGRYRVRHFARVFTIPLLAVPANECIAK